MSGLEVNVYEHSAPIDRPFLTEFIRRQADQAPLSDVATFLEDVLSRRLTAYICGVTEGKLVRQWASGEVADVSPAMEQRLRTAYEITLLLRQFDEPSTARAWFIGMSPELDDVSPAETIRAGRFRDAMGAARAFIAHG